MNENNLLPLLMDGSHSSTDESHITLSLEASTTASSNSESEEEHDLLLFPLLQLLCRGQRRHHVDRFILTVHQYTDMEFKEHFRLKRQKAYMLIDELETSGFLPSHTFGMKKISAEVTFLIFLWYIGNTEPLRTLSDRFDVSISSVFRILRRVVSWLLSKLDDVIKWPQGNNINEIINSFMIKKGINKCIGAIDGCHIRIQKPSQDVEDYCNRKKFFSIILQGVVDADMKFTNIYCGEPGSLHDARVLRRSMLYRCAEENKEIMFPQRTFILGDSAYPNLEWLVSPFRNNGHLTQEQIDFNYRHSATRIVVERVFGILKGRFRRLQFFNEFNNIEFVTKLVTAVCILHNICIDEGENYEIENDDFENEDYDDHLINENFNWRDRRNIIFQEMYM